MHFCKGSLGGEQLSTLHVRAWQSATRGRQHWHTLSTRVFVSTRKKKNGPTDILLLDCPTSFNLTGEERTSR